MSSRWIRQGVYAAFVLATACGGNVKGESGSPSEQLRANGEDRCKAACATLLRCGVGPKSSSSCVCPTCSVGGDCPCDCGTPEPATPDECESQCNESVQRLLAQKPDCDALMLKLLDCVASATCKPGEVPCMAESTAMKACGTEDHSSPPPIANPGSSAGGVSCVVGSGGGATPGPSGPQPGDPMCESGWQECSDGNTYDIECKVTAGPDLACTCLVNGVVRASFNASSCPESTSEASQVCGWPLI